MDRDGQRNMSETGKPNGSSHGNGTSETLAQIAQLVSGPSEADSTSNAIEASSSSNGHESDSLSPGLDDLTSGTLLESLSAGLAVFQGTKLVKSNASFALAFGYRDAKQLEQAGGSDALFDKEFSKLEKAFSKAGKAEEHKTYLNIKTRSGRTTKVPVAIHRIASDTDETAWLVVLHPQAGDEAKGIAEKIKLGASLKPDAEPEEETAAEDAEDAIAASDNGISPKKQKKKKSRKKKSGKDGPSNDDRSSTADFLAKVSHELRTPLNSIIGFAELMKDEQLGPVGNERYRGYIRDIHDSGLYALSLVNDLLDISKIKSGEFELNFVAVDLTEVISESVQSMQPQAQRRRVLLRTSFADDLPEVLADRRSIRQIILNLVSNAIKFTMPGGQVIVSVLQTEAGGVRVRVRDTGIGMTKSEVAVAMKPYKQVDSVPRPQIGTGLGLPLTKALVEANRARFKVRSATGTGTRIDVNFPNERVAERRA